MKDWMAVTTWFPPNRRESECKRLLSKWVNSIGRTEGIGVAYFGGIFTDFTPKVQSHAHIILTGLNRHTGKTIAHIDIERWEAEWRNEIVHLLSKKAADIKPGEDLTGWLKYILVSNVGRADDYRTLYFNLSLLYRLTNLKEILKGVSK